MRKLVYTKRMPTIIGSLILLAAIGYGSAAVASHATPTSLLYPFKTAVVDQVEQQVASAGLFLSEDTK